MRPPLPPLLPAMLFFLILIPPAAGFLPAWETAASPGNEFSSVAISADGSTILAGGDQLVLMNSNGALLWSGWSGSALDVSGDGQYIATSQGPSVRLFDRHGVRLWEQGLGPPVRSISMTPDGLVIAAGGGNAIQAWHNSGSGLGINTTETVRNLRVSPAGDQILVATDSALRAYNLSMVPLWYDDAVRPGLIGISRDGTRIVAQYGNHIRMYHGGGKLLWDRQVPGGNIVALVYSRDGSTLAVGRDDNTLVVMDRDGTVLFIKSLSSFVGGLGISGNGSVIAAGTVDNNLYAWDKAGSLLGMYRSRGAIRSGCVAVSSDGALIVAADGTTVYGFRPPWSLSPAPALTAVTQPRPYPEFRNETLPSEATMTPTPVPFTSADRPGPGPAAASGFPARFPVVAVLFVFLWMKRKTGSSGPAPDQGKLPEICPGEDRDG